MSENILNIQRVSTIEHNEVYGIQSIVHLNDTYICRSLTRKGVEVEGGMYDLRLNSNCGFYKRYTNPQYKYNSVVKAHNGNGMIEIIVPDRSFILFHIGNYPSDSDGCELVGTTSTSYGVSESVKAYIHFYKIIMPLIRDGKLNKCYVED